jgi:hypothetical protein
VYSSLEYREFRNNVICSSASVLKLLHENGLSVFMFTYINVVLTELIIYRQRNTLLYPLSGNLITHCDLLCIETDIFLVFR